MTFDFSCSICPATETPLFFRVKLGRLTLYTELTNYCMCIPGMHTWKLNSYPSMTASCHKHTFLLLSDFPRIVMYIEVNMLKVTTTHTVMITMPKQGTPEFQAYMLLNVVVSSQYQIEEGVSLSAIGIQSLSYLLCIVYP